MAFAVWSITTDYSYLAAGRLGGYDREERCVLKDSEREQQTAQSPQPANLDQVFVTTSAGICVEYINTGNCRQCGSPPFSLKYDYNMQVASEMSILEGIR